MAGRMSKLVKRVVVPEADEPITRHSKAIHIEYVFDKAQNFPTINKNLQGLT